MPVRPKIRCKISQRLLWAIFGLSAVALLGKPFSAPPPPVPREWAADRRKPMADFTLAAWNGQPWRLSAHRGHVVLLNFWATWCPPCQEETPGLVRISQEFHTQGLDVAGISMEGRTPNDTSSNILAFVKAYQIPYPILLPRPFAPVTSFVQSLPTTLLIDRQGRIANATVGALEESSLRTEIQRLLQEREK